MENIKIKSRLDEQAKVFTLVSNSKYCSVFRFTVVLKEDVNNDILLEAYKQGNVYFESMNIKNMCYEVIRMTLS